jgi:excinuclease ABC subunit C
VTSTRFAEQLARVPTGPGVYVMRGADATVLYVGKAANLRNRVRSYFGSPASMEGKTRALSESIADFEYVLTHTEQEALHLEAELVKRHQPFFNIRLKDDKHYPYLKVDLADDWPRVYITRRVEKDGARYFGPYANAGSVRRTLDIVNKLFPWRSCTKTITGADPRPCLDYYINRCIAPCTSYCTKEEYDEVIRQVILFLEGRTEEVVRHLRRQMQAESKAMQFERAARIRDQVQAVERVTERQAVASTKPADEDIFGLARGDDEAVVQVLFVRGIKMVGVDSFTLDGTKDEADGDVMASFIKQFYESATYVPKRVVVPLQLPEHALIESWLAERRGTNVELLVPQRGEKRRLVEMAASNARESLDMARVKWLAGPPKRIECYDISNIQGTSSVGSMVVAIDGHPRPQEYRRFRIKTVEGANDFASMAEVLRRRFRRAREQVLRDAGADAPDVAAPADRDAGRQGRRNGDESFAALPDLVIIDGGKGQLSRAVKVLDHFGLAEKVPVVGLAKQEEEIFFPNRSKPTLLPRHSQGLYLVQRIRDEAHRFAITAHRKQRSKMGLASQLDSVPGIGPARRKALLKHFGSVDKIREASIDELTTVVPANTAEALKTHLE